MSAEEAALVVSPTTLGTTTWQNPVDVTNSIAVPDLTKVPIAGIVFTTSPDATVFEHLVDVVELTVNCDCPSVDAAATVVSP